MDWSHIGLELHSTAQYWSKNRRNGKTSKKT